MTSWEKRCSDHSFETSKVITFLAGVKAKGSQCKWQCIQGVLAHLLVLQWYRINKNLILRLSKEDTRQI